MRLILMAACLVLHCSANLSNKELVAKYNALKTEFHQDAPRSSGDEIEHFAAFTIASNYIESHNERNDEWKADYNEFATMSGAEKAAHTGLNVSRHLERERVLKRAVVHLDKRNPSSADYTDKLPAIKNQGSCGSCWTFGATAALEYQANRGGGSVVALSEQQYLDCVYEGERDGCNGGWPPNCYDWTRDHNNMIASEADMPYQGRDGSCNTNVESAISGMTVSGANYLSDGDAAMENAVANTAIGVISVAIGVTNPFYSFSSGVYSGSNCNSVNHAVDVVGYGEQGGVGYWRVRNSWAANWGDNGYINMKRGMNGQNINTCSIAEYGHYPIVSGSRDDGGGDNNNDSDRTCSWEKKSGTKLKSGYSGMDYSESSGKSACQSDSRCAGISCKKNKCMLNEKAKGKDSSKYTAWICQ